MGEVGPWTCAARSAGLCAAGSGSSKAHRCGKSTRSVSGGAESSAGLCGATSGSGGTRGGSR
eukprot:5143697-Amphidinium_carterae.2